MMQGVGSSYYYPQMAMMGAMTMGPTFQAGMMGGNYGGWGMQAMQQSDRLQGMYAGFVGVAAVGFVGYAGGASRIEDDPNGVAQSGQGLKSNLANSPEVMLAMKDMLASGGLKSYDDSAKELKEKYGIQAEVGDIKITGKDGKEVTAKGLKFGNGDYFIDGNGNGGLDTGDYKFDDAVKNLKDKYGLTDDGMKSITERMKSRAAAGGDNSWGMGPMDPLGAQRSGGGMMFGMMGMEMQGFGMQRMGMQGMGMGQGMGMQGMGMGMGMQGMGGMYPSMFGNPMMNMGWMNMFSMAFQYAA